MHIVFRASLCLMGVVLSISPVLANSYNNRNTDTDAMADPRGLQTIHTQASDPNVHVPNVEPGEAQAPQRGHLIQESEPRTSEFAQQAIGHVVAVSQNELTLLQDNGPQTYFVGSETAFQNITSLDQVNIHDHLQVGFRDAGGKKVLASVLVLDR